MAERWRSQPATSGRTPRWSLLLCARTAPRSSSPTKLSKTIRSSPWRQASTSSREAGSNSGSWCATSTSSSRRRAVAPRAPRAPPPTPPSFGQCPARGMKVCHCRLPGMRRRNPPKTMFGWRGSRAAIVPMRFLTGRRSCAGTATSCSPRCGRTAVACRLPRRNCSATARSSWPRLSMMASRWSSPRRSCDEIDRSCLRPSGKTAGRCATPLRN
mmetsp:Transcript_72397/g.209581  ORF Transcript_72397/g.209581 Transcript_72397/m.209581 type:complete len:214 (+) Transcript_72397:346-987(+)